MGHGSGGLTPRSPGEHGIRLRCYLDVRQNLDSNPTPVRSRTGSTASRAAGHRSGLIAE
ncbi:DUF6207 family protein [Streptomyces massasporeus]|uniref:DUF6207 family protein n=1 Tax=Streptomyces massasporeus TaxID=67324 RepID=UPI003451DBFB